MTNPPNPPSPLNPIQPGRSSEPAAPGTDKFKDLMRVGHSDEKQKKKKKRSEEFEEEKKAEMRAGLVSLDKATENKKAERSHRIQKVDESQKRQTRHSKRSEEEVAIQSEKTTLSSPKQISESVEAADAKEKAKEKELLPPLPPIEESLDQIFEEEVQIVREKKSEKEKTIEPTKKEPTPSTLPSASSSLGLGFLPPAAEAPPAYTLLSSQALALFETMVSTIMVLQSAGMKETTVQIPEFANAQIVIREYSTAPLAYNIELIGNPEACAFFQRNLVSLQKAFQERKLRFSVNRLEASLSKEGVRKVKRKKEQE